MGGGTIAATLARYQVDVIRLAGMNEKRLCHSAGLDMAKLDDPNGRISKTILFRLFSLASEESQWSSFGLHGAELLDAGLLGIVGYTMMTSTNFEQALERMARYAVLIDDELEVWAEREEGHLRVSARIGSSERSPYDFMAAGVTGFMGFCKILLGDYPVTHEINVIHDDPGNHECECFLDTKVNFGMPCFSVLFDNETLAKPLRSSNPNLDRVHVDIAEARLAQFTSSKSVNYIRQIIDESLPGHAPSLGDLAVMLNVSKRTLQRDLEIKGTSFKELLDDVRKQQAKQYLVYSSKSMKEISWSLGFAELSSFYRSCHQWFGMTPRQYRNTHQNFES